MKTLPDYAKALLLKGASATGLIYTNVWQYEMYGIKSGILSRYTNDD